MTCYPATAFDYDAMCADEFPPLRDRWTGHGELWPLPASGKWWRRTEYEFTNDAHDPLTWHRSDGRQERPDRHIERTDLGSIPRAIQIIPALSKDRYARAYIFHDSAYQYGVVYRLFPDGNWLAFRTTRTDADEALYRGILAEGGTVATARTVWLAVRSAGWLAWNSERQAEARYKAGITLAG